MELLLLLFIICANAWRSVLGSPRMPNIASTGKKLRRPLFVFIFKITFIELLYFSAVFKIDSLIFYMHCTKIIFLFNCIHFNKSFYINNIKRKEDIYAYFCASFLYFYFQKFLNNLIICKAWTWSRLSSGCKRNYVRAVTKIILKLSCPKKFHSQ